MKKLDAIMTKVWKLINYPVESCIARQILLDLMKELHLLVLAPMQGKQNRWFFKWSEVWRIVQLRRALDEFFDKHLYELREKFKVKFDKFIEEGWELMPGYVKVLKYVHKASTILEGLKYPSAIAFILFVDKILHNTLLHYNPSSSPGFGSGSSFWSCP